MAGDTFQFIVPVKYWSFNSSDFSFYTIGGTSLLNGTNSFATL
jgi:hypothetical protein